MGIPKHQKPHTCATHKTHHQTGWHKRVVNPTTNYPPDAHKYFCRRCLSYNKDICPVTGLNPSRACSL